MKITKYPQSCLLIEKDDTRVIIDPGSFVNAGYSAAEFGAINIILITHEHADHADAGFLDQIAECNPGVEVVANESTKKILGNRVTRVASSGEVLTIANVQIHAIDIPHVAMVNGDPGPQNTAYIIDGILFHPGDGIDASGVESRVVAAPIAGPDISPRDVYSFVEQTKAEIVVPIHYNYHKADPNLFKNLLSPLGVQTFVLENGQSIDIK
jgi:L-ascorbate metabolism protein UlaG (beta-lactamase superfamily)